MPILLDTSVVIAVERRQMDLDTHVRGRTDPVFLSVISASELLHGVHRADTEDRRAHREAFVERVLATLPLLDVTLGTARAHARLWATLAARGALVGAHDLWIAASALAAGCVLATTNADEFRRIPGLAVEGWVPTR
jgi:tRNA(fMet)-specific endonuclease VapC